MSQVAVAPPAPSGQVITLNEAYQLAIGHEAAGRLDEAERLLNEILKQAPDQPDTLHLLGVVQARRENFAAAAALIERALPHAPNPALYHRNICEIYRRLGRYDDALASGRQATRLAPQDPHAFVNLAIVCYDCLRFDEGVAACERAIALEPNLPGAHFELAEALLVQGQFERGWREYEWRFQIAGAGQLLPAEAASKQRPHWDGTPLADGALLLIADQGFGDVIQFCRFIPWARRLCPNIALACSRQIQAVVAQICPDLAMFDRWDEAPDFAAYSSLSGLPQLYGVTLERIPAEVPYLRADPARLASWRTRLTRLAPEGFRRIGIVWAGRPSHNNDFNRSAALDDFAPLTALPDVVLVSLQKGPGQAQIGHYLGRAPLLNLGPELADYEDTMAVVDLLDLVVTVDTSVAHLAGAMNRPAWVTLPFAPDWRWLLSRADTPWYPSLRLLRQATPRDWSTVFDRMAHDISRMWGVA